MKDSKSDIMDKECIYKQVCFVESVRRISASYWAATGVKSAAVNT